MPPDHGVESPVKRGGHATQVSKGNRVGMSPLDAPHHLPRDPGRPSQVFLSPAVARPHRPECHSQLPVIHAGSQGRVTYRGLIGQAGADRRRASRRPTPVAAPPLSRRATLWHLDIER
ncbi:MAG TPA: hypothetical protein VK943_04215, partial [Arenibaculum sp.]|nr:hypothetical protein [Arenibaculum sp.]